MQDQTSTSKWLDLFNWAGAVLQPARRGGKRHSLAATIKKHISTFQGGQTFDMPAESGSAKRRGTATIDQAVASKLEDGNVRAAIRILMSTDTLVVPSHESFSKMSEKHLQASNQPDNLLAVSPDNSVYRLMNWKSVGLFCHDQWQALIIISPTLHYINSVRYLLRSGKVFFLMEFLGFLL